MKMDTTRVMHTPGPWEVRDERGDGLDRIIVVGQPDNRSKHRHGRAHIVEMRGWMATLDDGVETVVADAHLIAAAPDLLAALHQAIADQDQIVRVLRRAFEQGLEQFSTLDMLAALVPHRQTLTAAIEKVEAR